MGSPCGNPRMGALSSTDETSPQNFTKTGQGLRWGPAQPVLTSLPLHRCVVGALSCSPERELHIGHHPLYCPGPASATQTAACLSSACLPGHQPSLQPLAPGWAGQEGRQHLAHSLQLPAGTNSPTGCWDFPLLEWTPDRTTQASGGGKDVRRGLTPPTWPALEQSSASVATLHLDGSRSAGKAKRLHTRLNRLRLLEWGQSGLPPPCCFGEAHTFVGLSGGDPADRAGLRVRAARTAEKAVGRQAPGPGVQPSEWCDRRFRQSWCQLQASWRSPRGTRCTERQTTKWDSRVP